MKLDRTELLKAIKFLKPAIMESEEPNALEYVHVKTIGERCQLTAGNKHCGKRATLFTPQQLTFDEKEELEDMEFMIDKPILEAYEKLLSKHKTAFSKAVKTDNTLNYIRISPFMLESHKDTLRYNQPKFSYPDLDKFFVEGNYETNDFTLDPVIAIDAMKEFVGDVQISFAEHREYPGHIERVYMQSKSGEYQAFFLAKIPKEVLND